MRAFLTRLLHFARRRRLPRHLVGRAAGDCACHRGWVLAAQPARPAEQSRLRHLPEASPPRGGGERGRGRRHRRRKHPPARPVAVVAHRSRLRHRPADRRGRRGDRARHDPVRARPHLAGAGRRAARKPGFSGHLSRLGRGARPRQDTRRELRQGACHRGPRARRRHHHAAASGKGRLRLRGRQSDGLPAFIPRRCPQSVGPRRSSARPRRVQLPARGGRRRAPDSAHLAPWR